MKDDSLQSTFDYFPLPLTEQFFSQFYQTVINKILKKTILKPIMMIIKYNTIIFTPRYRLKVQEKLADTMIINLQIFLRSEPENIFNNGRDFYDF